MGKTVACAEVWEVVRRMEGELQDLGRPRPPEELGDRLREARLTWVAPWCEVERSQTQRFEERLASQAGLKSGLIGAWR